MVVAGVIELRHFTRGARSPEAQQPGYPATGTLVRPSLLLSGQETAAVRGIRQGPSARTAMQKAAAPSGETGRLTNVRRKMEAAASSGGDSGP